MLVMASVINGRRVRLNLRTGEIFMQFRNTGIWKVKSNWKDKGYLVMNIGNKNYKHHRVIYKFYNPTWDIEYGSNDNSIDHINGHTDDNQIANLRNVTNQQNKWNHTKAKGYCWNKASKKWVAYIKLNNKRLHLGLFDVEADARNAYLEAKKIYHIINPILCTGS